MKLPWGVIGLAFCFFTALLPTGCDQWKREKPIYYRPPIPPLGIEADVVVDENVDLAIGGRSRLAVVVAEDIDRDELDRLMNSFFRQVAQRDRFRGGTAERIDIRFYATGTQAKKNGDDWIGQILRASRKTKPAIENRQPLPLAKWARKALGKMPHFSKKLRPTIRALTASRSVEIRYPYVELDGSGRYVENLSFSRATASFASTVSAVFEKVPQIAKLTFIGEVNGRAQLTVELTRSDFQKLGLDQIEETMGAIRGRFVNELASGATGAEHRMQAELAKERRKRYEAAFARLPADRVIIAKGLR